MPEDRQNRTNARTLPAILLAAFVLRLLLAGCTAGYRYDLSCFFAWGDRLASVGPRAFYAPDYFADYPPGYLWVLGAAALLRRALGLPYGGAGARVLLALVPAACDAAITALVFWTGRRRMPDRPRFVWYVTLFTAFDPLLFYATGVWGQVDSAYLLPLLLCFCLLEEKRWLPAALAYGAALAVKPQALLAGPVLAVCFAAAVADAVPQGRRAVGRAVGRIFGGAALALAPAAVLALPFFGAAGLVPGLLEKYLGTGTSYPYASVNAFNWLGALGGNWQPWEDTAPLLPVSWRTLGMAQLLLLTAALVWLAVRLRRRGAFSPLVLAAFYTAGVFVFAPCMHERYLLPGVLFALLAAAALGSRALYAAGFGLSLTGFLNLAAVLATAESEDPWFFNATGSLFLRIVGTAATALFCVLALTVWALPARPDPDPVPRPVPAPLAVLTRGAQPRWQKRELAGLCLLTAATAVLSFGYLGDTSAPQNGADANGGLYMMTAELLPHAAPLNELWVYPGISVHNSGTLTVTDSTGAVAAQLALDVGATFRWHRLDMSMAGPGPYTVTVTDGAVLELCFRDAGGEACPMENRCLADPLFDEQALVPHSISQLNGFYFDEIYHARTAYEQLHALPVYETTHPPLGKDLMMLGIALFGMTGFGWRFAGTLFGVLLVPLAWCFARRLTRRRWLGALAGVLLALDFMRFAQSRIATVDVFAAFFILLGAHCMVRYCQTVLQKGVTGALVPMALGGLAFGLGCAAKWNGIYAGAGLAVLYFGVLWARYKQRQPGFGRELGAALAGGVLFYLVLPLCVYLASYLPYLWRDPGFDLNDWWAAQVGMFRYHAGLTSTHPFESRWYTWLLGLRPVWYYANGSLPAGQAGSIAGLGGPVLWLAGLAAVLALLWRQVSGRGSFTGGAVLVLYAAQLVPWMLVTRCTFLYHYFPGALFCLAAIVTVLAGAKNEARAKRLGAGLCAAALVLFALYYPVLSGLPVPAKWLAALRVLPSFSF